MFARAGFCYAHLYLGNRAINIWDYIPHTQVILTITELQRLLNFIAETEKSNDIYGNITYITNYKRHELKVKNAIII